MIAYFYMINETFAYPDNSPPKEEVELALDSFISDYRYIKEYKSENVIFFNESIFPVVLFPDITIEDYLSVPQKTKDWNKDIVRHFQIIWDKQENFTTSSAIENIGYHDEDECFGLIGLHPIALFQEADIDSIYVVYNQYNWLAFRRHFLGLYPKDGKYFIGECEKYFPELYFHEHNQDTINKILSEFSVKIIHHLTGLNNSYKEIRKGIKDIPTALKTLSIQCDFDETASNEGKQQQKKRLEITFSSKDSDKVIVCCEPHIKLSRDDRNTSKYYFHRIYFHEPIEGIADDKILIGHIGEHL